MGGYIKMLSLINTRLFLSLKVYIFKLAKKIGLCSFLWLVGWLVFFEDVLNIFIGKMGNCFLFRVAYMNWAYMGITRNRMNEPRDCILVWRELKLALTCSFGIMAPYLWLQEQSLKQLRHTRARWASYHCQWKHEAGNPFSLQHLQKTLLEGEGNVNSTSVLFSFGLFFFNIYIKML